MSLQLLQVGRWAGGQGGIAAPLLPRSPARLLKWAALLLCFGLSALAGPVAVSGMARYLLMGIGGLTLVAFSLYRLEWGILVMILSTTWLRLSLSTGTATPLVISLLLTALLTGLWIVRMIIEDRRLRWLPSPVNLPLLGFVVVAIASYFWSDAWRDPMVDLWDEFARVRVGALAAMILSPAALWLVANRFRDERLLQIVVGVFTLTALIGLPVVWFGLTVPLINLRGLFSSWAILLTLSQALFNRELKPHVRLALGLLAGAWFYYSFIRNVLWISGWLPPMVGCAVVAFLRSRKLFALLVILGLIFAAVRWEQLYHALVVQSEAEGDFGRVDAWAVNWRVTRDHLFLGTGPAGYAAYYMSLFPLEATATHSNYVDVLAQTGLVGMGFFVWFLVAMGVTARRAWRRVPKDGFAHALAAGCIGGYAAVLAAMSLGDWFLPFAYTQGINGYDYTVWGWIFMGVLVGLSHYQDDGRQTTDDG